MDTNMAYLLGMILGNGEIQFLNEKTIFSIEIPHKNLKDYSGREVPIYVQASIENIRQRIEPLIDTSLSVTTQPNSKSTVFSFTKSPREYLTTEIQRFIGTGIHHSTMNMNPECFKLSNDHRKEILRGIADVTGYIRTSNAAYSREQHRVYIEVPGNWHLVADICNLLKSIGIPVQTIDWGHPNFRDSNLKKYNEGKRNYWKKEHQIKIWANQFLPVGFNIRHKQQGLIELSNILIASDSFPQNTDKFYWEKQIPSKNKPIHPMEEDPSLPLGIRGNHYDNWQTLAQQLGYHA